MALVVIMCISLQLSASYDFLRIYDDNNSQIWAILCIIYGLPLAFYNSNTALP